MDQSDIAKALSTQNDTLEALLEKQRGLQSQITDLQQKAVRVGGYDAGGGSGESPAAQIVEALTKSPMFEQLARGEVKSVAVRVPLNMKATTISSTALVQPQRDREILRPLERRLTIRDLLPVIPTRSGSVEYTRETGFTNNAGIQVAEGDIKGESGLTFDLVTAQVRTIAHWIPASRQVLEDRSELQEYIESRLLYGLGLKEEAQLLNGDGTGSNLNGIVTQATAYSAPFTVTSPTRLDMLRLAITQLQVANASPTAIVINPIDWGGIELTKDSTGQYIKIVTDLNGREIAWRLAVVPTNAMPVDKFLVGDFARGAAIRDRHEARVEVSREHADYFTRNLVAILAEERIALTVFRPASFVYGDFGLVA